MRDAFLIFVAALALAGCDSAARRDLRAERDESGYRAAMADYQAGRLDAAVEGFRKVSKADPSNAGARFQLACLLQDYKKDYLGAYCAFREYLHQHGESDKAALAGTRLANCEREVALLLAAKYKIDGGEHLKTIDLLRKELADVSKRLANSETELQAARSRSVSLSSERDRLVEAVKGVGIEDDREKSLGETSVAAVKEAKDLLDEEMEEDTDRTELKKEIAALKADEKEESQGSSLLLPQQPADAKAKRAKLEAEQARAKREAEERDRNRHPPFYIVQEGDTLYRLAERFYGRISAWKTIRDANRAIISNDGRLKTGTKLILPYLGAADHNSVK